MNITLLPYTWSRHLAPALVSGSVAVVLWWLFLAYPVLIAPLSGMGIRPEGEGPLLLGVVSGAVAALSLGLEGRLRREGVIAAVGLPIAAFIVAWLLTVVTVVVFQAALPFVAGKKMAVLASDPAFVALRYRLWSWLAAGFWAGAATFAARAFWYRAWWRFFDHLGGGLAAGSIGAATYHIMYTYGFPPLGVARDLYLATPLALCAFAFSFGLFVWGIPDELYGGWLRVMTGPRAGYRIPILKSDGTAVERFVGHYPRGLDVNVPVEAGAAELHVSLLNDGTTRYAVRGLSQAPTQVKRMLESVDLRYDPSRPAPLETDLHMEDRVLLGTGAQTTDIEFLLLPKEDA